MVNLREHSRSKDTNVHNWQWTRMPGWFQIMSYSSSFSHLVGLDRIGSSLYKSPSRSVTIFRCFSLQPSAVRRAQTTTWPRPPNMHTIWAVWALNFTKACHNLLIHWCMHTGESIVHGCSMMFLFGEGFHLIEETRSFCCKILRCEQESSDRSLN